MKIALTIFYTTLVVTVLLVALLFVGHRFGLFGYELKIVQSGSMEPAIPTGALLIIAPAERYGAGDVITFGEDTATKIPTTHRITDVTTSDLGRALYTTKGDANEEADPIPVRGSDIIGKVWLSVPYVGYVLEFARTPLGYALLVGIPAAIIILDEFANITWEIHKYRARKRAGKVGYRVPSRQKNAPPRPTPDPRRERAVPTERSTARAPAPRPAPPTPPRATPIYTLDLRTMASMRQQHS